MLVRTSCFLGSETRREPIHLCSGIILREPLGRARWLCENVRFRRFGWCPWQSRLYFPALNLIAKRGLSSTVMGFVDLGLGGDGSRFGCA